MALNCRLARAVKAAIDRIELDRDANATVSMGGMRFYRSPFKKVADFQLVIGLIAIGGEAYFQSANRRLEAKASDNDIFGGLCG